MTFLRVYLSVYVSANDFANKVHIIIAGTGLVIGHVLLLGELINFVPSAHPTIPLIGIC